MLASTFAGLPSARASNKSTARFNCSIFFGSWLRGFRERLGIGTLHARAQAAEGAELQLLYCALGLADLPCHFLNALLPHDPQAPPPPLLRRQRIHKSKQGSATFDF